MLLMDAPAEKVADETFNIGYENMSIMGIAEIVKAVVEEEFPGKAPIEIVELKVTITVSTTSTQIRSRGAWL